MLKFHRAQHTFVTVLGKGNLLRICGHLSFMFFNFSAAGVVPCGIPKKRPRTSSIVQFILYFWFFGDQQKYS